MPVGSATRLLHLRLQLKRIVTVRELARSQGFSDDFVFYSLNGDVNTVSPRFSPRRTAPRSLDHSITHATTHPSVSSDAPTDRQRRPAARRRRPRERTQGRHAQKVAAGQGGRDLRRVTHIMKHTIRYPKNNSISQSMDVPRSASNE